MPGIVYLKSNETVSLTGSQYTGITIPSNAPALYIQTGANTTDRVKYGFTTDVSASIYSPKMNVNNSVVYLASGSTWTAEETTGTSYETTTSVTSAYYDTISSTTESTGYYTYNIISDLTIGFANITNMYISHSGSMYSATTLTTKPFKDMFCRTEYSSIGTITASFKSVSYVANQMSVGTNLYTRVRIIGEKSTTTSLLPMDNTAYTYGDWARYTEQITETTNTSYDYDVSESIHINNDVGEYRTTSTNETQRNYYDVDGFYTHTSSTTYKPNHVEWYQTSTTRLSTKYAEAERYVFPLSVYQLITSSSATKTYYMRWPRDASTTANRTAATSATRTADGAWLTFYNTARTGTNYTFRRRYKDSDGDTVGKCAKGDPYIASANFQQTKISRTVSRTGTYYYTKTYYYTSESCRVSTAYHEDTGTVTTNTIYLTRTYSTQTDNCNVA